MNVKEIIQKLQLKPHPEGGFYKETYQSDHKLNTNSGKKRHVCTAIYYLLENGDKSLLHRLESDELWFFHHGNPLELFTILEGEVNTITLGNNIEKGEQPQTIIPANTWFSAKIKNNHGHSLVSCVVAPGFDFEDFQLAKKEDLFSEYPHLRKFIENYTK